MFGELAAADVVIHGAHRPAVECKLLVVISAEELRCPSGNWFYHKPVDLDVAISIS